MTKVNYALAPAGATHYDFYNGDLSWLKYDRAWLYFDNDLTNWDLCEQDEQPENKKEIPMFERELNRLADGATIDTRIVIDDAMTWNSIEQRRAERIEAGLIAGPIIDEGSKEPWLPEIGEECEYIILGGGTWFPRTIRYILAGDHSPDADGWRAIAWCSHLEKDQMLTDANAEFRKLKTPEQKAREEFAARLLEMSPDDFYNYLKNKGVDLMPILEELNK